MTRSAFHILRVGMAITFLWIGVLILREPDVWGSLVHPWVAELLPTSLHTAMIGTAFLDLAIGLFLLLDVLTLPAAVVGFLHILIVLVALGITVVTVRDIGLGAALVALILDSWPRKSSV